MANISRRVSASADDGFKFNGGAWSNIGSTLFVGRDGIGGGNDYTSAMRFNNITIPQGATINSAILTLRANSSDAANVLTKIYGFAEDDTADFSGGDPSGRTKTTAAIDYDRNGITFDTEYTVNITTIIQEIINRGGWASGNDLGLIIVNDGSGNGVDHFYFAYDGNSAKAPLLDIDYGVTSPSASQSPSSSMSPSSSRSPSSSLSASLSPSASASRSFSASPSSADREVVLLVAKQGIDALKTNNPIDFKFDSRKGTLKYFTKQAIDISFDANAAKVAAKGEYSHNLGYYPYVEVFVRVYTGATPSGNYEYCPFAGSGATVPYDAGYKLTTNKIEVYGQIGGVSTSVWHFDFLVFIYKNNLNLS